MPPFTFFAASMRNVREKIKTHPWFLPKFRRMLPCHLKMKPQNSTTGYECGAVVKQLASGLPYSPTPSQFPAHNPAFSPFNCPLPMHRMANAHSQQLGCFGHHRWRFSIPTPHPLLHCQVSVSEAASSWAPKGQGEGSTDLVQHPAQVCVGTKKRKI